MHDGLREQVRLAEGRATEPSAAILDGQSLRVAETVAKTRRGFDDGKEANGMKRHIVVDGLLLVVLVTAASVQDREGGPMLLRALAGCFRRIHLVWVEAYSGGPVPHWGWWSRWTLLVN